LHFLSRANRLRVGGGKKGKRRKEKIVRKSGLKAFHLQKTITTLARLESERKKKERTKREKRGGGEKTFEKLRRPMSISDPRSA